MVFGYVLSSLAHLLLGLMSNWCALLLLRSLNSVGKGLRHAPLACGSGAAHLVFQSNTAVHCGLPPCSIFY
jgi:hypothetical protein